MAIVHPALIKLYSLQWRGTLRNARRTLSTVRGALMALFAFGMLSCFMGQGVIQVLFSQNSPSVVSPAASHELLSVGLLAFCVLSVVTSASEQTIHFSPGEIDFLFPAPFSRRELLLYKIVSGTPTRIFLAAVLATSLLLFFRWWLAALVGFFLCICFVHALSMCVQLGGQIVTQQAYTHSRRALLTIVGSLIVLGISQTASQSLSGSWLDLVHRFRESWGGSLLLAPVQIFANVVTAPRFYPHLLGWSLCASAIVAALYAVAVALDANYLEAAVRISQKIQDRVQRARRGAGLTLAPSKPRGLHKSSTLPLFPWLGGTGPIARRQVLLVLRSHRGLATLLVVLLLAAGAPLAIAIRDSKHVTTILPGALVGGLAYVTFILSSQMPLAFRGDGENMEVLKSLPLSPLAIACGQVAPIAVLLTAVEICLFLLLWLISPESWQVGMAASFFALPFNLLMFQMDGTLFLLYPLPTVPKSQAGLMHAGRHILFLLFKTLGMLLCAVVIALPAAIIYLLVNNWIAAFAAAWIVSFIPCGALFVLLAWAFQRFDVSERIWE